MQRKEKLSILVTFVATLCLTGSMQAIPSPGSQVGREASLLSFKAEKMPLNEILDRISKFSGYEIVVNGGCPSLSLTVRLENVSLLKALQIILKRFNHTLFIDDSKKMIELTLYGQGASNEPGREPGVFRHEEADLRNIRLIPSNVPGKTEKVMGANRTPPHDLELLDVEVIPPEIPGEAGMTLREIERSRLNYKRPKRVVLYDHAPLDGERAETRSSRKEGIDLQDLKVMNSDSPQEKDLMRRVIESYDLSGEQSKLPHVEIVPPEIN